MNAEFEEIREQQKQSWNKFSGGWKKWDTLTMEFLHPVGEAIIADLNPKPDDFILDIASGTGEPALTIAGLLSNGKLIMTDVSADMLAIAKENAIIRGINNVESIVCDVCELPFSEQYFNSISCRFGFMFFPDMQLAANEMYRVLKIGGKVATSVWDIPEKNFWVTAIMGTINKYMQLPQNPSGTPGMFRCCKPGLMKTIFENAKFKNIESKEITTNLNVGTEEIYWAMMTEIGAPIVAALSKADNELKAIIKQEVCNIINEKYLEGNVKIPASAIVISAQK